MSTAIPTAGMSSWERELAELAATTGARAAAGAIERATATVRAQAKRSAPLAMPRSTWPGLAHQRAVEHVVADIDAASAATPHGTYAVGRHPLAGWVEALTADRTARLLGRLPLVEVGPDTAFTDGGVPALPTFTVAPTAGPQGGQKDPAYSRAFTVAPDDAATLIDSSLHLNISMQLDLLAQGATEAFMRLAVVSEAEAQVVAAVEAGATAAGTDVGGALATFTGSLYVPSLLLLPPDAVLAQAANVTVLQAAGVQLVLSPSSTVPVLLDPAAVVGYLLQLSLGAIEPSVLGRGHSEQVYGQVSVAAAGAASYTAP